MTESKKRDNGGMEATLDIVSRSFNQRRDAPMIFTIVPHRFFGRGVLAHDPQEILIGETQTVLRLF